MICTYIYTHPWDRFLGSNSKILLAPTPPMLKPRLEVSSGTASLRTLNPSSSTAHRILRFLRPAARGCSRRPPSRTASHMHPCISQARLSAPPQTAVPAAASASWRRARRASGPLSAPSPSQAPSCARSRGPNCRPGSRKLVLVLAACSSPTSPSLCAIRRLGTRAERPTSGAGNLKFDDTDRSGNRLRPSEGSRRRRGSCLLGRRGGPPPWPGRRACAWLRRAGGWTYLASFGHIGEGLNPRITALLKKQKNEGLRRKPPRAGATRERRWTRGGGDGSGPDRQLISGVACPQGVGGGLASSAQGPSVHCSMNGPKKKRF